MAQLQKQKRHRRLLPPGMTIVNPSWKKAPMPSGKSDKE
jgi:hypothetical protein